MDKIDKDGDDRVTDHEDELKNWVKQISRRYVSKLIVCVCIYVYTHIDIIIPAWPFSPLALYRLEVRGVSHFFGWQEYTVTYGNKCNIDDF